MDQQVIALLKQTYKNDYLDAMLKALMKMKAKHPKIQRLQFEAEEHEAELQSSTSKINWALVSQRALAASWNPLLCHELVHEDIYITELTENFKDNPEVEFLM